MIQCSRQGALVALVGCCLVLVSLAAARGAEALPPIVESFQCYAAVDRTIPRFSSREVDLADEFQAKTMTVRDPVGLCTPVAVDGQGVSGFNAHLACYSARQTAQQPRFQSRQIGVTDQFGDLLLTLSAATDLCVPSVKDSEPAILLIDHFLCYSAQTSPKTPRFAEREVVLEDQFGSRTVTVKRPESLCVPVDKNGEGIGDSRTYLTCYGIVPASNSPRPTVTIDNQFGTGTLTVTTRQALCVRSVALPCVGSGVFVSASLGDDATGTGSKTAPVKTIARAIEVAVAGGVASVCVSGEEYQEAVDVASGVSIFGGFDQNAGFLRTPTAITRITAPGAVLTASQVDADTTIERVTLHALTPSDPGASTYGVLLGAGSAHLRVRDSVIVAAAGQAGSPGTSGLPAAQAPGGDEGQGGCQGAGCGSGAPAPSCSEPGGKGGNGALNNGTGQTGNPGSGGAAGGPGGESSGQCFAQSEGGDGGTGGASGAQGTPGTGGAGLGTTSAGGYVPATGGNGSTGVNARGGGGGGGGGGGSTGAPPIFCNADTGGGGGAGGCGGLGGSPGLGGRGGGGSFGIFAAGGVLVADNNDITTGSGGHGGAGGNGAGGQSGGEGGSGGPGFDDSGPGGKGGPGGSGGAGGPGGGGGGGPTACVAVTASVITVIGANGCLLGTAGSGGAGGTNPQGGVGGTGNGGVASADLVIP